MNINLYNTPLMEIAGNVLDKTSQETPDLSFIELAFLLYSSTHNKNIIRISEIKAFYTYAILLDWYQKGYITLGILTSCHDYVYLQDLYKFTITEQDKFENWACEIEVVPQLTIDQADKIEEFSYIYKQMFTYKRGLFGDVTLFLDQFIVGIELMPLSPTNKIIKHVTKKLIEKGYISKQKQMFIRTKYQIENENVMNFITFCQSKINSIIQGQYVKRVDFPQFENERTNQMIMMLAYIIGGSNATNLTNIASVSKQTAYQFQEKIEIYGNQMKTILENVTFKIQPDNIDGQQLILYCLLSKAFKVAYNFIEGSK